MSSLEIDGVEEGIQRDDARLCQVLIYKIESIDGVKEGIQRDDARLCQDLR